METLSTTSALLTEQEAAAIVAAAETLNAAERRIAVLSYLDSSTPEQIRGAARTAEALDHARRALQNALSTAAVYGNCAIAERALEVE